MDLKTKGVSSGVFSKAKPCNAGTDLMCCEFAADGRVVAAGTSDGLIKVFSCSSGDTIYCIGNSTMDNLPVTAVKFLNKSPENTCISSYASGSLRQWHVTSGQCLWTTNEKRQTLAVAVSPHSMNFSTAGSDKKIYLYDLITHKIVHTFESSMSAAVMDGHSSRVFSLSYHPTDPNIMISAGWDDTMQFWDVRKDHAVRHIFGPHICGDALDIHPQSQNILTGSWRYQDALQVWDYASGKLLMNLEIHQKVKMYAARWINDSAFAGGSQENSLFLINPNLNKVDGAIENLCHGVYGISYSSTDSCAAAVAGNHLFIIPLCSASQEE